MNPVFIVGAPRSGTTLLAAMLSSHRNFNCGPETHFFIKTTPARRQTALKEWPDSAIRLLSGLRLEDASLIDLYGQNPQSLYETLASRSPREATLLEVLTEPFAGRCGKQRWVEKTPNHLLHVREIVEVFPDAAVVRIVRDPRASAHSMRGLPFGSNSFLVNCIHWMNWHTHSQSFFRSPGRHFTLRYEDLVADPEVVLARLCGFLGEDYDPAMLDYQSAARLVQTKAETWKAGTTKPLNTAGTHRWRREVVPEDQNAAALFLQPALEEFGYAGGFEASRVLPIFVLTERVAEARLDLLTAAAKAGVRIELQSEPPTDVRPIFGSFDLRGRPRSHSRKGFLLLALSALLRALARGERPLYLTPIIPGSSRISRMLRLMVTSLGRAVTVDQALEFATPVSRKEGPCCEDSDIGAVGAVTPLSNRFRS